jgi:hypothetical protein
MEEKTPQNNENTKDNLISNDNFQPEESFIDFIEDNFDDIKIAGCTRITAFGWLCK